MSRPQDHIVPNGTPLTLAQLDGLAADCVVNQDAVEHRRIIARVRRAVRANAGNPTRDLAAHHFTKWCEYAEAGEMNEAGAQKNALIPLLLISDTAHQMELAADSYGPDFSLGVVTSNIVETPDQQRLSEIARSLAERRDKIRALRHKAEQHRKDAHSAESPDAAEAFRHWALDCEMEADRMEVQLPRAIVPQQESTITGDGTGAPLPEILEGEEGVEREDVKRAPDRSALIRKMRGDAVDLRRQVARIEFEMKDCADAAAARRDRERVSEMRFAVAALDHRADALEAEQKEGAAL